jgi:hypothetical protein
MAPMAQNVVANSGRKNSGVRTRSCAPRYDSRNTKSSLRNDSDSRGRTTASHSAAAVIAIAAHWAAVNSIGASSSRAGQNTSGAISTAAIHSADSIR